MSDHKTHDQHPHSHGSGCGHTTVKQEGHVDYLHDGHLHNAHAGHMNEHALGEGGSNPSARTRAIAAEHTTGNILMEAVAVMKRFRTVPYRLSRQRPPPSHAPRATATTTGSSRWLDNEIPRAGFWSAGPLFPRVVIISGRPERGA